MTEIIDATTLSGFPVAQMFYLTTPGGSLVANILTADGKLIRQEITRRQLATLLVEAMPHVVRA